MNGISSEQAIEQMRAQQLNTWRMLDMQGNVLAQQDQSQENTEQALKQFQEALQMFAGYGRVTVQATKNKAEKAGWTHCLRWVVNVVPGSVQPQTAMGSAPAANPFQYMGINPMQMYIEALKENMKLQMEVLKAQMTNGDKTEIDKYIPGRFQDLIAMKLAGLSPNEVVAWSQMQMATKGQPAALAGTPAAGAQIPDKQPTAQIVFEGGNAYMPMAQPQQQQPQGWEQTQMDELAKTCEAIQYKVPFQTFITLAKAIEQNPGLADVALQLLTNKNTA